MPLFLETGYTLSKNALIFHSGLWADPVTYSASTVLGSGGFYEEAPANSFLYDRFASSGLVQVEWGYTFTSQTINAIGIAAHNFGTCGAEVAVQVYQSAAWVTVHDWTEATDNTPRLYKFASKTGVTAARFLVRNFTGTPEVGFCRFGRTMTMPRPTQYPGRKPFAVARTDTLTGRRSSSGYPLPATIIRQGQPLSFTWQHLPESNVSGEIADMLDAVSQDLFMIAERPSTHPNDVAIGTLQGGRPIPTAMGVLDLYQMSMEVEGYIER